MRNFSSLFLLACVVLCGARAAADFVDNNLHSSVSIASAVSMVEADAVSFGNFAVTGSLGGGDADLVLDVGGNRTVHSSGTDVITLLNGGYGGGLYSAARPGLYRITGAGTGSEIYISFVETIGSPIDSSNPVVLAGPTGSDTFNVDNFTFNVDGTDTSFGDFILADGAGKATLRVGATLHTKIGATRYAPGTYRGTFGIVANY